MFQIINDTKSAPSASIVPVKIPVSPLSNQKAHVLANYVKFANHFSIWTTEMETPNFKRITQNPLNSSTPTANHMKLAKFALISDDSLSPFHIYAFALISSF